MKEIIRLENVIKMVRGRRAVNGVSFGICEKEHVAVCGAPGSGKNMLMRLIAGMDTPSEGEVYVLDKAVHEMDDIEASRFRNRNIGVVRREPGFMENQNIIENVSLPLAVQRMTLARRKRAAEEQLEALGISHLSHAFPSQLSAYEALAASVARALVTQPKILMFYEITAGLSERETEKLTGILGAISYYGDYMVISFGADPVDGLRRDRTVLLSHGKIQEDWT